MLLESSPETPREVANALSEATGADVIQVIGGVIVLWRESPEKREKEEQKARNKKLAAKKAKEKYYESLRSQNKSRFSSPIRSKQKKK